MFINHHKHFPSIGVCFHLFVCLVGRAAVLHAALTIQKQHQLFKEKSLRRRLNQQDEKEGVSLERNYHKIWR